MTNPTHFLGRVAGINGFILLSILFTTGPLISMAQFDFSRGYLVRAGGDTTVGFVSYELKAGSQNCFFKQNENDHPEVLSPKAVLGFRIDKGKVFTTIEVDESSQKVATFAELIIQGRVSLYCVYGHDDRYFIRKDGLFIELTEPTQILRRGSSSYVKQKMYKGKLRAMMIEVPEVFPVIEKTRLTQNSLLALIREYDTKVPGGGSYQVFEDKSQRIQTRWTLLAGFSYNDFSFANKMSTDRRLGVMAGVRVEAKGFLPASKNLSVSADFLISHYGTYTLTNTGDVGLNYQYNGVQLVLGVDPTIQPTSAEIDFNIWALKVPLIFKYIFSGRSTRPYLGAGIQNVFVLSQNESFYYAPFSDVYGAAVPFYHFGVLAKAGAEFGLKSGHSLFVEGQLERTINLNINEMLRFTNSQFGLVLGYTF